MIEKHTDPAYVTFVLEKVNSSKTKATPPDASNPVKPRSKKPGKNTKRDEYPSDDSYEPSQDQPADKKRKTHQGDKKLTLLDLAKEPKVVPITEPAPKDPPPPPIPSSSTPVSPLRNWFDVRGRGNDHSLNLV